MARFCNKCNYPIEEGGMFCSECGSSDIRDTSNLAVENADDIIKNKRAKEDTTQQSVVTTTPVENTINPGIPEIDQNTAIPEVIPVSAAQAVAVAPITVDINPSPAPVNPPPGFEIKENEQNTSSSFGDVPSYMTGNMTNGNSSPNGFNSVNNGGIAAKRLQARRKNNNGKLILWVVILLFVVVGVIIGAGVLYSLGKQAGPANNVKISSGPFTSDDIIAEGNTAPSIDYSTIFTPQNSFRVGSESFGFVSIPNTWVKFADVDGNTTLQYTDNGTWIVTVYAMPTNSITAVAWANNVYNNLSQSGGSNLKTSTTTIDNYAALVISAYYEDQDKYLTTWFLESKSGKTHYLALEGPEISGDNYNIIYSFKENV